MGNFPSTAQMLGPSTPPKSSRSMERVTPRKRILKRRLHFVTESVEDTISEKGERNCAEINLEKQTKIKYLNQDIIVEKSLFH